MVAYVLLASIASVIAVLLIVLIYPVVLLIMNQAKKLDCDESIWIWMRTLGMCLSFAFVTLGLIVNKKISDIQLQLSLYETKIRRFYLW